MKTDSKLIKLCGLWENKTQDGKVYLSGNLGDSKVFLFKNKNDNPKAPAWNLVLGEKQKKTDDSNNSRTENHSMADIPF